MCVLASCLDPGTLLVLCEHMADHFLVVTVSMPQKYNMLCYRFDQIKEISCLLETDSSPKCLLQTELHLQSMFSAVPREKKKEKKNTDRKCGLFCRFIFF